MSATDLVDVSHFRCPCGSYIPAATCEQAALELRSLQRTRSANGWSPILNMGIEHQHTGMSVWCSNNWPMPRECRNDAAARLIDGVWHQTSSSGEAGYPVRSVFGGKVEFIHNYKVASTSLAKTLACEYGPDLLTAGDGTEVTFLVSAFAVRDPISRFVSAVQEVLQRYINHICPSGPCTNVLGLLNWEAQYAAAEKNTHWWRVAATHYFNFTSNMLPELLEAFIADARCCHAGYAMDHFQTQSAFSTYSVRGVDVVIHLEDAERGLNELAALVGLKSRKCGSLGMSNDATKKPTNIPSSAEFLEVLRSHQNGTLIEALCEIYMQDFMCFDLALPLECGGHSAPPPPRAAPTESPPAVANESGTHFLLGLALGVLFWACIGYVYMEVRRHPDLLVPENRLQDVDDTQDQAPLSLDRPQGSCTDPVPSAESDSGPELFLSAKKHWIQLMDID